MNRSGGFVEEVNKSSICLRREGASARTIALSVFRVERRSSPQARSRLFHRSVAMSPSRWRVKFRGSGPKAIGRQTLASVNSADLLRRTPDRGWRTIPVPAGNSPCVKTRVRIPLGSRSVLCRANQLQQRIRSLSQSASKFTKDMTESPVLLPVHLCVGEGAEHRVQTGARNA